MTDTTAAPNTGLMDHLKELRRRLMFCFAMLIIATMVTFTFRHQMFTFLRQPLADIVDQKMIVIGVLEMFVTYLKLAVVSAIFISAPWWLLQAWLFISPGLHSSEKRWTLPFVIFGTIFFLTGGLFAFYVVLPLAFEYLVADVPQNIAAQFSVSNYFNLVIRMLLAFGIVFELPLVMWILAAAHVVSPTTLRKVRPYWIIIAVILAAFLTPPDPFTQMLMAVPLMLFFELGLLGARFLYRQR